MRFSLYLNAQTRGPEYDGVVFDALPRQAVEADEAGFAGVFLTEHHFNNYNTFCDPFMFGAYLAPQLKRAYLGLSVAVSSLYNPLRFAEQANILDRLTNGRAIIGYGVGSSVSEFASFGIDVKDSRELAEQVVDIAVKAWAQKSGDPALEFETPYFHGRLEGRIMPSSVRQPHPLLARACVSEESIIATARRGRAAFFGRFGPEKASEQMRTYKDALSSSGHSPERIRECLEWTGMLKMIYVAETDEQARRDIQEPGANYARAQSEANNAIERAPKFGPLYNNGQNDIAAYLDRIMIHGSPETVAAQIQEYADAGIPQIMLWCTWGYNDPERVQRSLRLFIDEVAPRFPGGLAGKAPSAPMVAA